VGALVVALALSWSAQSRAQDLPEPSGESSSEPSDVVEAYMQRLGLKRLEAEDLAIRLQSATGQSRLELAERLAKLYVVLLSEAKSAADRRAWEDRAKELVKQVPEADSYELKLSLTKTLHLQATEVVERHRLRMATPEEVANAERILRSIQPQLEDITQRMNRRVEAMEALEEKGDTSEKLEDDLSDARRVRSQAFYYLGWTDYYLGFLTDSDEQAAKALKAFGWLLNSPGDRLPSLERIQRGYLKYEHVSRAAAGCALATALRGNYMAALAWLDAIEEAEDLPAGVAANLPTWRIAVLASSKRWADLERYVRLTRNSDRTGGGPNVKPLGVIAARLLAVSALEADKSVAGEVIEPLAAIAMGDLVASGEIGHVLDLVQRYGTAPIGEKGFIPNYVRGIQEYEVARAAHKAAAGAAPASAADEGKENPADLPTTNTEAVAAYRIAATLFQAAVNEQDAEGFKVERTKASQLWAFSLFYAGDLVTAADRFLATAEIAATPAQSEEAMWLAVLSLDHAAEKGDAAIAKRRDETATLFLQTHPDSEHAPKLLLRRAMTGSLEPEEAVRILMGVEKDSPMYGAARQHAARLLYQLYRTSHGSERDFAAMRFVGVAEETLNLDRRIAMDPDNAEAADAAKRIVARVRQILDALLGGQATDPARAEAAMDILNTVATAHKLDISDIQTELKFRRVQIALAKDDTTTASGLIEELQADGGQFAVAADQLMYKRALTRRERGQGGAEASREIIHYGERLIERMTANPDAMKDNVVLSLHQVVAEVASELWDSQQDAAARDTAIKLDTRLLQALPRNQAALHRLARNADAAGDQRRALDCWRTLMSGLDAGTSEWYEARYESLRLLAALEPARAKEALRQHVVLYPDYGPEPWGTKLKKLDEDLAKTPTPPSNPAPADPAGGGK
jgi:hypothetical protein